MKIKIIGIIFSIIFIFKTSLVFAYGIETHAALTQEIFYFYNQHFSQRQIPEALKDYLIDGSRKEDVLPRFWNHFYDPVYDRGLNDPTWGKGYPSKVWAQDSQKQNEPIYKITSAIGSILSAFQQRKLGEISTETNFTWQKAIEYYLQGEPEKAMFTLGHILHLIEDLGVPAHTRNDGHPAVLGDEDTYEVWTHRFTRENIHQSVEKNLIGKKPIILDDLDSYFVSLASYSNNNFYSDDTIGLQSGYNKPEIDFYNLKKEGIYHYITRKDNENNLYHLIAYKKPPSKYIWAYREELTLEDEPQNLILNDYWSLLSSKVIQYGAGVIDLFFREVEKAKKAQKVVQSQPPSPKNFLGQFINSINELTQKILIGDSSEIETIPLKREEITEESFETQIVDQASSEEIIEKTKRREESIGKNCHFETDQEPLFNKLIINEIAWMGNEENPNKEWIELKNIFNFQIDISGYQLIDKNEQIKVIIPPNTLLNPGQFYLLERNDDDSVPKVKANFVYKGALSNKDEALRLFDQDCNLLDEVFADPDWPAGDNKTKKTMERGGDLKWYDSLEPLGTPQKENSILLKKEENKLKAETKQEVSTSSFEISSNLFLQNISQNLSQTSTQSLTTSTFSYSQTFKFIECSFETNKKPNYQKLIINEVAWMGQEQNPNAEWIELKNLTNSVLDLNGYQLIDRDEQIKIIFDQKDKIPPKGFYLLERTRDETVPNISADKIYTGALSNNDEGLRLFDNECNLVDEVLANPNWPGGDNLTKRTMERKDDLNWQTSEKVGGTPKAPNGQGVIISYIGGGSSVSFSSNQSSNQNSGASQSETSSTSTSNETTSSENEGSTSTPTSSESNFSLNHIVISEIMPGGLNSPEDEFIELYNPTDQVVNLDGWSLVKKSSLTSENKDNLVSKGSNNFNGKIIEPKGFLLIASNNYTGVKTPDVFYSQNSHFLANNGDVVILYDHEGNVVDEVFYGAIERGKSWERKAFFNNQCLSAQGEGEFLGNGCDTDGGNDFEIREIPNPQNYQSLKEPRNPPNIRSFNLNYRFDSGPTLLVDWVLESNYSGPTNTLSYILQGIDNSINVTTSLNSYQQRIYEIGRFYEMSLQAVDQDGLASERVTSSVFVPSFLKDIKFYSDPSSTLYLIDLIYDSFPFIPNIYGTNAQALVFYLNQENPNPSSYIEYETTEIPEATLIRYQPCHPPNYYDPYPSLTKVIVLPISVECFYGPYINFLNPGRITQNEIKLALGQDSQEINLTENVDYLKVAFYVRWPWTGVWAAPTFEFLAVDKTKYFYKLNK